MSRPSEILHFFLYHVQLHVDHKTIANNNMKLLNAINEHYGCYPSLNCYKTDINKINAVILWTQIVAP